MTKQFKISQILVYYDLPELFIANDEVGTKFICLLTGITNNITFYYATPISKDRLSQFIQRKIELFNILKDPEINVWYSVHLEKDNVFANKLEIDSFPANLLPEKGFFVNNEIYNNELNVKEVIKQEKKKIKLKV